LFTADPMLLKRNGVRIDSPDIYQAVDAVSDVTESLAVGVERPEGNRWIRYFSRWPTALCLTITYHRRFASRRVKAHHHITCPMTSSESTLCHTR
jgi:hypothetical protein